MGYMIIFLLYFFYYQVVTACAGSVITMWMIDTGQKVKQVCTGFNDFSKILKGVARTTSNL